MPSNRSPWTDLRCDRRHDGYRVEVYAGLSARCTAALHDDAARAEETDRPQSLAWYDDLVALTDDPVRQDPSAVLGRAVAVGPSARCRRGASRDRPAARGAWRPPPLARGRGHPHELDGDLPAAATAYADAARPATNVAERDHLVHQAAGARAGELCRNQSSH